MLKNKSIYLVFLFFIIFIALFLFKNNFFYSKKSQILSPLAINPTKKLLFRLFPLKKFFLLEKEIYHRLKKKS